MHMVIISICTKDSHSLDNVAAQLRREGYEITLTCADSADLEEDVILFSNILDKVSEADLILIKVHGDVSYFKKFDKLKDAIDKENKIAFLTCTEEWVQDEYRYMFREREDYDSVDAFITLGGDENNTGFLKWALNTFDSTNIEVPAPLIPPAQGAYHPDKGLIKIEEMTDSFNPDVPTVAILFYQKQFLAGNTKALDSLIRSLEKRGVNVLPVFLFTSENKIAGAKIGRAHV